MKNNLVSIITPSYNSSRFISQTIESVLSQTYQYWEMLIIDDCSMDNSNDIISKYTKEDNRIKLIKLETNNGPAVARNIGIKEAKGQYIAFLDSDDLWKPKKLEKQIKFMKENKLWLTYSAYDRIDKNNNILNNKSVKEVINYEDMLKSNHIGNLTGIYDCTKMGKLYMDDIGHEDYLLWLKIMKQIETTQGINESLAQYRVLTDSLSSNKIKALKWQWHIYRNIVKLNVFDSSYYLLHYIYNAIIKRNKR